MNFAEVKQLLDAGFKADEIRQFLSTPEHGDSSSPVGDVAADPVVAPPATDPAPQGGQEKGGWEEAIAKLASQVSALTSLVEKNNILNSDQPPVTRTTGEDILQTLL